MRVQEVQLLHPHDKYDIMISQCQTEISMSKMGRPTVDTAPVTVRLPSGTIKQIDEARRQFEDLPTRPEMIRRMIEDWLQRNDPQ